MNFCTLFDSKYLAQGLVLYQSMLTHITGDWTLYILPMDSDALYLLRQMNLPRVEIVEPEPFELTMSLSEAKRTRTHREYCWTCASNLVCYLMSWHNCQHMTYLDADQMFFSDTKPLSAVIGDASIAVVPHNFIPQKQYLIVNGQFNVGLIYFKNDVIGRACVMTWAEQCREMCSENVGCGDQKYLDAWPDKYGRALCIIRNPGIGLAPWNLANYTLTAGPRVNGIPVVIYHYHEYIHNKRMTNYELRREDQELIYSPYMSLVEAAEQRIAPIRLQA